MPGRCRGGGIRRPHSKRRGGRSRADIEAERHALWEKTRREIDELAAQFHALMARDEAEAIGAIYARYSTRHQDSAADQVRSLLEDALKRRIFIPSEFIFVDLAVRGYKSQRAGLDELRAALEAKKVSVVLFFATNRLFRKTFKALEFVDHVAKVLGIRCIFLKSGVDTADAKRWEMLMHMNSMMDQFVVSMYADNVRAAQEGLLEKRCIFGSISFGYMGEPIPNEFTRRKRPRCRLAVDPETSKWVDQIFCWYVNDRLHINEIVRRLNDDPEIPVPPRCTTDAWNYKSVRQVLTSTRSRGLWKYGVTETVWVSDKDYARKINRAAPLKEIQIEELRIVSDQLWFAAQQRLAEDPHSRGRKSIDGNRKSRPKLLNGIFFCPDHDKLYVGGPYGKHMFCKACVGLPVGKRTLFTKLNRARALRLTCERLAQLIRADSELVDSVVRACQAEADLAQRPNPERLRALKAKEARLTKLIEFNRRNPGDTDQEQADAAKTIRQLGCERSSVSAAIAELEAKREIKVPTAKAIRRMLSDLGKILVKGAAGKSDNETNEAREIIKMLTGGRILLYQQGERAAQRGWLRGRFAVNLLDVLVERAIDARPAKGSAPIEVVIDYVKPEPSRDNADRAYAMYQEGALGIQIAKAIGLSKSRVTKLLQDAHAARGEEMPDGRSRRSTLANKHQQLRAYQLIADEAVELMNKFSDAKIAKKLGCRDFTVARAIRHWHEIRNLPVPTTRERRNARARLAKRLVDEEGMTHGAATAELECCNVTFGKLMDLAYQLEGRERPDGRSQRKRHGSNQAPAGRQQPISGH